MLAWRIWRCCATLLWLGWFVTLTGAAADAAEPVKTTRLRVLSYNIHHGEGVDGKLDLKRIARIIRAADVDIVALQEVDQRTERTGNVDQPAELARLTEMQVVYGNNIKLQGGAYGNALLSRHRVVRHSNHVLPRLDEGEQRGLLEAEIELPGSAGSLWFLATHLDHRRDDRERVASAKQINELVTKQRERPALLTGDLNDVLGSKTLRELQQQWTSANREPLPTVPVDNPKQQIDFVLFRPADQWTVTKVEVLDEAVASDHRPILVELQLKPAASAEPQP